MMTSKYIDERKRPLQADEKLDAATLRDTELTDEELGKVAGGKGLFFRNCCTGKHFDEAKLVV
jgi:hypothetical protein